MLAHGRISVASSCGASRGFNARWQWYFSASGAPGQLLSQSSISNAVRLALTALARPRSGTALGCVAASKSSELLASLAHDNLGAIVQEVCLETECVSLPEQEQVKRVANSAPFRLLDCRRHMRLWSVARAK